MADDPAAIASRLIPEIERRGIRCAVGGALCLAYWGVPRATKDLDLNVFVPDTALGPVFDALQAGGCVLDRAAATSRARERGELVAFSGDMRVDVFISFHAFHDEVSRRLARGTLPDGTEVGFLSAEDLCVFKVLFYRAKDLVDIDRLLLARGERFDAAYVEQWLVELLGTDDPRVDAMRARLTRTQG